MATPAGSRGHGGTARQVQAVRCFFVGTTKHLVNPEPKQLRDWLRSTKIERFDSVSSRDSWFYLWHVEHLRGFIAHSETVLQGTWDGPGWYRSVVRRSHGARWLTLSKGDIRVAMQKRFVLTEADKARFNAFIAEQGL